jgi:signal transduction histidine kinase
MLIGYRRIHNFADEEREIISTLASSATIAIMNQRWLGALHEIDRKIITSLDYKQVLNLIIQEAVRNTPANLVDISLLDPASEELIIEVWHPKDLLNVSSIRMKIGEGITGHCFKDKKPILSNDVQNDPLYISCFEQSFEQSGSELCVPLLDDHRVLGVLNLESYRIGAFEDRHIGMMETLAGQAVIAIQNVRNKEQIIALEKVITLGDLAGVLFHTLNGDLGAILRWTQEILRNGDDYSKEKANEIINRSSNLRAKANRLKALLDEQTEVLDLRTILESAISEVGIPSSITQEVHLPDEISVILASQPQLVYVFSNLIQNALDAMSCRGKLLINCRNIELDGNQWNIVEVSDTGKGVSPDARENIFQLGYTTKFEHTGFGLWWSQTYIKRLGGDLKLKESPAGYSTTFAVILPRKLN